MVDITAAVLHAPATPFVLETVTLDEPREDEVLVRLVATGVCHTDIIMNRILQTAPAVLGHEGSGIVERVGSHVSKVKPGDHVVLSYLSCGHCKLCLQGKSSYCQYFQLLNMAGIRMDGSVTMRQGDTTVHGSFFGQSSFATYALATERNVVNVRADVPLELLGPLGCGVQTGAGAVMNALAPRAGSSLVVFGTGAVGLSAIMAARVVGCTTIIGVDIRPQRLALAQELGATHIINGRENNTVEQIQQITGGGASYSLETTAIPALVRQAVDCLQATGTCGVLGASAPGTEFSLVMGNLLLGGRIVRGIIEGDSIPDIFIPQLIELFMQGRFPFDKLIKTYPFAEINQAIAASESGETIKPVLTFA